MRAAPSSDESGLSGAGMKAGALRVLRRLDLASFDVLWGKQAKGEGDGRIFMPPAQR